VVILNDSEGSAVVLIDPKGKKQILHFIQDDKAEDQPLFCQFDF
jgi:hypothetical protein